MTEESAPPQPNNTGSNWISGLILGIVSSAIVSAGVWWFTRSTVDPVYLTYKPEVIAKNESPRLTVQWDGMPIENLCVASVALWNAGNIPIRSIDLPVSDPLRIVASTPVRILSVEAVNTSRKSLRFDTEIGKEPKDRVFLRLKEGEAIEGKDGVAYRLLYTGDCKATTFNVVGRVVEKPDGFRNANTLRDSEKNRNLIASLLGTMLGGFLLLWLDRKANRHRFWSSKDRALRTQPVIVVMWILEACSIALIGYILVTGGFSQPNWLPASIGG